MIQPELYFTYPLNHLIIHYVKMPLQAQCLEKHGKQLWLPLNDVRDWHSHEGCQEAQNSLMLAGLIDTLPHSMPQVTGMGQGRVVWKFKGQIPSKRFLADLSSPVHVTLKYHLHGKASRNKISINSGKFRGNKKYEIKAMTPGCTFLRLQR